MLKIQFKDKRQQPVWVVGQRYTIGRADSNHLVADDPSVSALHARLLTRDGALYLKDNNSERGCYVNGQRVTEKQLLPGDEVRLGDVEFVILDPADSRSSDPDGQPSPQWSLVADSHWLSGREYPLTGAAVTLGRSSQCDIAIAGTQLSRQHVQLSPQEGQLHIRNLAKDRSTYLNDERIDEALARPGDRLRLDIYSFTLVGPGENQPAYRSKRLPPGDITPIERRPPSQVPRRWKTRPTSPGNRQEPPRARLNRRGLWLTATAALLAVVLLALLVFYSR